MASRKLDAKRVHARKQVVESFAELEHRIKAMVQSPKERDGLWHALDYNGNGLVSLAEIDKWVVEQYPLLDHKPALMRAYKKTTLKDGDGDAWVEKHEFGPLVRNLFYFNKLFKIFDGIDTDDDNRIDFDEFFEGLSLLGVEIPPEDAEAAFKSIDVNGGGFILFDELCAFYAKHHIPVDGEVATSYTMASKKMGHS
jgi:hypothetical protein